MGRSRNPRRKPPCHVSAGVTTPVTAASQFRISVILCDYSQIRPSVGLRGGSRSGAYRGSAELRAEAVGCQFVFTTNTARSLAGSVSLALALTRCRSRKADERSKRPGFILPCQPALADRPPSGPGWLHEIKFDGYRVIARKDGEQVCLWARTTSDYSKAFTRIRDAVAALAVDSAVLDGEAVLMRRDNTFDFEGLRSRQGQAAAILVAYDVMELDGQDVRPEPWGRASKTSEAALAVATRECATPSERRKRLP